MEPNLVLSNINRAQHQPDEDIFLTPSTSTTKLDATGYGELFDESSEIIGDKNCANYDYHYCESEDEEQSVDQDVADNANEMEIIGDENGRTGERLQHHAKSESDLHKNSQGKELSRVTESISVIFFNQSQTRDAVEVGPTESELSICDDEDDDSTETGLNDQPRSISKF